ncbi:hypothetical protein, partial [Enterobacter bugandensis]|uniref:hypothetical protein n=1 Tax=Enterobacter bugandensis TaxID=881260 RepID=UPI00178CE835
MILDDKLPDTDVRDNIFNIIPEDVLKHAVNNMTSIIRPANNVYFNELDAKYKTIRRFLPDLLSRIHFKGTASTEVLIDALSWIEVNLKKKKT